MPESASQGVGGVCSGGRGVSAPRGCLVQGDQGVPGPEGMVSGPRGMSSPGGSASVPSGIPPPPPVNRMTNKCKNITLATTSLRPVKMNSLTCFEYCQMHLNQMSILPTLCILGELNWHTLLY